MIVRRLQDIVGGPRDVRDPNGHWTSRRLLLRDDGMGFSMHDTLIHAGTETLIWYKHHLEGVYCVGGEGEIENLATGEIHPITNGTFYGLNLHDKHLLRAHSELRLICTFNPPLHGAEVHGADGSYPPP
ncbi:MAG: ectoine synthase [Thiohalomonadaceae bacterium]